MSSSRASSLRTGLRHVVAAAALAVAGPYALSHALAQGVEKGRFGDWRMRCETPPGASAEQCALIQSVIAEDKDVKLVVVAFKTSDGKGRLLRVIAPLGVLLPEGLRLTIDKTDVGRAGFVKCMASGCFAEVMMDDKLLDQLRNGTTAIFIIYEAPNEGVGLPFTLAGFKEGWGKLP